MSDEVLFKRCFEKMTAEAEEGRGVERAPRMPVMVIAALELGVVSLDVKPVVVMWTRLLKVYGALRSDDLQRMRPDGVTLAENGFTAKLGRTKTTGGGKKVRELVVYVPREAWVAESSWLQAGFELWRALAPWDRDHFLPRPLPNLEAFEKWHAGTMDIAGLSSEALTRLCKPVVVAGRVGTEGGRWIPKSAAKAWTGHSERATLASALASLGVGKDERNPLRALGAGGL